MMQDVGGKWPPRVDDYVYVATSDELGLVREVAGRGDTLRFLVSVYPQVERPSPRARQLVARSPLLVLCRLDELAPDPDPPGVS
jgi:hypothetical protein